jgi:hypothetical protein
MRMQKTVRNGKKVWVLVTLAEGVEDIRRDTGTQGWFEMQRALIAAVGKEAEVFQGGAGMVHNTASSTSATCCRSSRTTAPAPT